MKKIKIIGPSHVVKMQKLQREGVDIHGYQSAPIFMEAFNRHVDRDAINVMFVTTSHRFNYMYNEFKHGTMVVSESHYDSALKDNPFLFNRGMLKIPEIVKIMDGHLCRWLDIYQRLNVDIRFVFLCEFFTHCKRKKMTSMPERMKYEDFMSKYKDNSLEIFDFLADIDTPIEDISDDVIRHLTPEGSELLLDWIINKVSLTNKN